MFNPKPKLRTVAEAVELREIREKEFREIAKRCIEEKRDAEELSYLFEQVRASGHVDGFNEGNANGRYHGIKEAEEIMEWNVVRRLNERLANMTRGLQEISAFSTLNLNPGYLRERLKHKSDKANEILRADKLISDEMALPIGEKWKPAMDAPPRHPSPDASDRFEQTKRRARGLADAAARVFNGPPFIGAPTINVSMSEELGINEETKFVECFPELQKSKAHQKTIDQVAALTEGLEFIKDWLVDCEGDKTPTKTIGRFIDGLIKRQGLDS